jgi:Lar family restriction alleviation protein
MKPCPFCGNANDDALIAIGDWLTSYAVFCDVCEASGPDATSAMGAIERWENRSVSNDLP